MKQHQPQATQLIASPPPAYTISWPIPPTEVPPCSPPRSLFPSLFLFVPSPPLQSKPCPKKRATEINLNASSAYAT